MLFLKFLIILGIVGYLMYRSVWLGMHTAATVATIDDTQEQIQEIQPYFIRYIIVCIFWIALLFGVIFYM